MTEKEQVQQIVKKYNKSIADLSENASAKEFKTVMNYVADEANRKQRKLVGLDQINFLNHILVKLSFLF
ncbi:TPA: hypothetical protein IVN93_000565 [Enterococcus faecium]|nr:hypothetical protein [Enterococcus faecium]